ncbi:TPA: hypothetical protein N0F65_007986 [Lagenidium giganteum]|uniref:Uncharacterized protein n=1 Tax=Lagenidium giganteum TaxID=4803 RepID=A0AAV2YSB5_9STRA|nr:TPA: hypothetical protein N0F65_007986 [Lagenidium giganteum]
MQLQTLCKLAVALVGVSAMCSVDAAIKGNSTAKNSNMSMSVGDGTTVQAKGSTTVFLDTEYNPAKCILQFDSLQCDDKSCGELNGYKLQCVAVDGKKKKKCQCSPDVAEVCQNETAVEGTVPQFGDCSSGRKCVDSYGHVPTGGEAKTCAEKLHCVKEIDTDASKPAKICHTCRSCIAQNDKSKTLSSKKRFDCTKICPQEILDELNKRNKKGVGIADEFSSSSGSSESSESGSSSGSATTSKKKKSNSTSDSSASKKSAGGKKSSSATSPSTIVGAIVAVACSFAMLS